MMADDGSLSPVLRFVPAPQRPQALGAIAYAARMLDGLVEPATIETWCYEFAAGGVDYQDWPDLVLQRHSRGEAAGETASGLERARLASEAMGLIDYGEI